MSAPATASAYMAAAEEGGQASGSSGPLTGPPTATGPQWRSLGPWTIPERPDLRHQPRQRLRPRLGHRRRPGQPGARAVRRGQRRRLGELRPRRELVRRAPTIAATLTVGAIAFDPCEPGTVYCGTGEGNWWSWLGAGILRSTDGGTTWSTLCTAPFVGQGFYDLIIDPANSQRLYRRDQRRAFHVSTDGGVDLDPAARRRDLVAVHRARPADRTAEILAACSRRRLFRSTDGGATWTAVALPGVTARIRPARRLPSRRRTQALPMSGARSGATAYLCRRVWRHLDGAIPVPPGVSTGQAWYDWYVAAAPDRTTRSTAAAIESYRGDLAADAWTWRNLSNKGSSGDSIHPDQHAIAFEPGDPPRSTSATTAASSAAPTAASPGSTATTAW